ncbi:hypothetical protein BD410DRAFT_778263 [Rickenella mellea]|uniref:Uncharacterized protein n=1 Tax=Rickenella mellea TaxID=50990 RepID=A0A4Y7PL50_9AGAM|nr:hypothetical protein BD410DRAFT_778263 [Rickenella mellea]
MSLPATKQAITEHPPAGHVTDPVNKRAKDADIDRKLRFFGVIEAFHQGRLPDNSQIDETLSYVRDHSPVDIDKLSPDGQKLIQDVRDIVETARVMVLEKNADELFQNFLWHTSNTQFDRAKQDPNAAIPVSRDQAQSDGQQALQHLRTLFSLVLTNAEMRKLLADFSIIGRDILARSATHVTDTVIRPDQDRLQKVDHPAPDSQFHTAGGRVAGNDETPVVEARVPGTEVNVRQHPREEVGRGAGVQMGRDGQEMSGQGVMEQGRQQMRDVQGEGMRQAQMHGEDVRRDVEAAPTDEEKKETAKVGLKQKMVGVKDGLLNRVPQEHKDRANDQWEQGRNILTEEYFPAERRDQFIYRLKKVIVECQKHSDYESSMTWLLSLLENYAQHGQHVAGAGKDSHASLTSDPSLQQAMTELRTLLERFANNTSLDTVFGTMDAIYADAQRDEELRGWFRSVDAYARKVLLEPGFVLDDESNHEANRLQDSGKRFVDDKYKSHFDNLFDAIGGWFRAMGEDPVNVRFGDDWGRLTRDLLFDGEGSLKFKPHLWEDIRGVVMPQLVDQAGYIPIPRIEYTDDALDLVLENLTLSGRNIFPNIITMEGHNFVKFSPYQNIAGEHHEDFRLRFAHMQADLRDVAFWFRKKTGVPKLEDSGLADVVLGGEGITIDVHVRSANKNDKSSVFHVNTVNVKVDDLKFSIRDSKHDALYNMLRPLATGLVKKQIQKAFADAIRTGLEYVDGQLVGVRDRMAAAKADNETDRTRVLQEMFKRKKDEAQSTASNTDKKFNVATKADSVLIPDKGHPAGWINKQSERSDAATSGSEWRSKAFTII